MNIGSVLANMAEISPLVELPSTSLYFTFTSLHYFHSIPLLQPQGLSSPHNSTEAQPVNFIMLTNFMDPEFWGTSSADPFYTDTSLVSPFYQPLLSRRGGMKQTDLPVHSHCDVMENNDTYCICAGNVITTRLYIT